VAQPSSSDGGGDQSKTSNGELYPGNILQDPRGVRNQDMVILSLDHEYRYLYFNSTHSEAMNQTYGTKPAIGDCIFDHIKIDEDANEVKKYYDRALSGEGHISIRESGSGLNHSIYRTFYNPIYDDKNEIIGVSVFAQDVTAQKLAEKKMQESDRLRELLLDIITHDLKNPAGVVLGMAQLVLEQFPGNELIEAIYSSSKRLLKVLDDTTILSQAAFGEVIPSEPLNLRGIITDIAKEFSSMVSDAGISLELDIDSEIEITANPLIGEIFKNYISNAIKYASDGKKILIDALPGSDSIQICVKDFGSTIPEEVREQIFERRTQLAGSIGRGRGLGLAIVKRIAEAHGGKVWVEANYPQGNCFCLKLPFRPSE